VYRRITGVVCGLLLIAGAGTVLASTSNVRITHAPCTVSLNGGPYKPGTCSGTFYPAATGWPNATNTGVPAGTVLTPSGSITVTVAGTVLNALDISGFVDINANNVTIKNSRIRNGSAAWEQVRVESGTTGAVIEDTEIDGQNVTCSCSPNDGYGIGGTGGYTALRDNIHNNIIGVGLAGGSSPATLQDSWVHDLHQTSGSHNEDIICDCSPAGVTIRHNRLDNQLSQTATVFLAGDNGPVQNVTVDDNLLNGAGFPAYGGYDTQKPYGTQDANVKFTNNHFMRTPEPGAFWPNGGYWGPDICFDVNGPGNVWSGNVWDDNGASVPIGPTSVSAGCF
jgi:hypothetical protein